MIDKYTGKKITRRMGSIWPAPAVEYHMTSGRVARISFWAPSKATPQELIERGVMVACSMIPTHGFDHEGVPAPELAKAASKRRRLDRHGQDVGNAVEKVDPPYNRRDRISTLYVEDKTKLGLPLHTWQGGEINPWKPPQLAKTKISAPRSTVKEIKTVLADVLAAIDAAGLRDLFILDAPKELLQQARELAELAHQDHPIANAVTARQRYIRSLGRERIQA